MFDSRRHVQCASGCLQDGLGDVMLITAVEIFDMQIETAFLHKCLEELLNQFRLKIADSRRLEIDFVNKIGPPGKIDHNTRQSLIQRHVGVSEARNTPGVAPRLKNGLSKDPPHIFDSMVPINFEIAFRGNLHVEMPMARQLSEHVIKERDARADLVFAPAVEIQAYANIGLICFPCFCRFAGIHSLSSKAWSRAARNRLFCSGVPIETRRHRSSSGYELTSRTSTLRL